LAAAVDMNRCIARAGGEFTFAPNANDRHISARDSADAIDDSIVQAKETQAAGAPKSSPRFQFGFGLGKFQWIVREIFRNDMVDMKAAYIDQLSGICTLFLVRQPYGLSLCRAEFLTGHRDPTFSTNLHCPLPLQ
jgi:hypothetical protein